MSFVGIIRCVDGLVAFGDTKSSMQSPLGTWYEETGRVARKVFGSRCFLLTAFGNNRIKHRNHTDVYLEDFLATFIEDEMNIQEFLFTFMEYLKTVQETRPYEFIVGYWDSASAVYKLRYVKVTGVTLEIPNDTTENILCGGCRWYYSKSMDILARIGHLTVANVEQKIPTIIRDMVCEAEKLPGYNPVNGDINTVVFQN